MNPIQTAKDHWLETGLFDEKLLQAAAAYVQANPLAVDRQYYRILTELQKGKPRFGDGETKILLRQREAAIQRQKNPGPYYIPLSKPAPEPPAQENEPDYLEIDL
jgi:hypothetical protein